VGRDEQDGGVGTLTGAADGDDGLAVLDKTGVQGNRDRICLGKGLPALANSCRMAMSGQGEEFCSGGLARPK